MFLEAAKGGVDGVPRTLSNNISLVQIDLFLLKKVSFIFSKMSLVSFWYFFKNILLIFLDF